MTETPKRLGKNLGGYFGERLDISAVLADCVAAARAHGWAVEEIPAAPGLSLTALTRRSASLRTPESARRVYISAGIHGDEPAGPLAVRQLLADNAWPANVDLWVCPCLNPAGFPLNSRQNPAGLDLNRQYRQPTAPETVAHIAWMKRQPNFDFCMCLHEDWESHGFYIFEANPDNRPSYAQAILDRVSHVCPIDRSPMIEGWEAHEGIIHPYLNPEQRPDWPEALFLITSKTRLSYTVEAPSDFPLSVRVAALVAAVNGALEEMVKAPISKIQAS